MLDRKTWCKPMHDCCKERCSGQRAAVENSLKQALPLFLSGLTAGMVQREPLIRAPFPIPENSQPDSDVDWDFLGE